MNGLLQDIQYGARVLLRRPSFTIVAALILTLAIGANLTIFTFIDTALLRPLPYRDPQQLVKIWDSRQSEVSSRFETSYPDYLDWKQQNQAFTSLAAYSGAGGGGILDGPEGPQMVPVGGVSDNFFQTLGVAPLFGRVFQPGEDLESAPKYVVLSHGFWQRRFGGRRDILGQSLTLNGNPRTIVGVLPRNFHFAPLGDNDIYIALHASGGMKTRRNLHWLHPVGRLKPGVSLDQAQGMMNTIAANLEKQYPDSNKELRTVVVPLSDLITGQIKPILMVLLAAVGLLLLIACANIANLLLARSSTRAKEFAIRSALGARRWRVVRQLIVEGTLLASVGTAAGILFALIATRWMIQTLPQQAIQSMPYLKDASLDPRILLFAVGLGLMTALLFSLPPALGLSVPLNNALKEGGHQSSPTAWKMVGSSLVVAEVAISAVLLVGSGLLLKSLYRLLNVDTGFTASKLTTFYIFPDVKRYNTDEQANLLHDKLIDALRAVPGVSTVGATSTPPIVGGNTSLLRVVGAPLTPLPYEANSRDIDSGYFSTLQANLKAGRYFNQRDSITAPKVVIINETLAKIAFGDQDPIGKQIVFTYSPQEKPREVVGVVADVHEGQLSDDDKPAIYAPFAQGPDTIFAMVVRSDLDRVTLWPELENAVHQVDPGIVLFQMQTMEDLIAQSPAAVMHRYPAWLVSIFAVSALLLGVVGLYGVVSYSVSQRTREIGVRMALGAPRGSVLRLVLANGARLAAIGIAAGVAGAVLAGYFLRSVLFGVKPWDVFTLVVVAGILSGICVLASYVPAFRASRLDPVKALRYE